MLGLWRMSGETAVRRLGHLRGVLGVRLPSADSSGSLQFVQLRWKTTDGSATIGDVSVSISKPKSPELVPVNYIGGSVSQAVLKHLRWIMQKDLLGQDVFLIGPPGPLRRNVAMMYLEMTQRELEYVSLSRDTTEADLKQRREIRSGTAYYIDQCAVRAATEGRVLVLEGIEKAERNVLPVLNNLLENREMQLDDGRFLMAADRYDKLLQDHSKEELDSWKLVRVDNNFRVIALGLPVPRYQGNPLDPPLRSRFQARDVNPLPFKQQLDILLESGKDLPQERLSQLLSFATTMLTSESTTLGLPDFPVDNLTAITKIMNAMPNVPVHSLIERLYPYETILGKEGVTAVEDTLTKFELMDKSRASHHASVVSVSKAPRDMEAVTAVDVGHKTYHFPVPSGSMPQNLHSDGKQFVKTAYHDKFLTEMLQSHSVKDFCLIGPKGCGKSAVVKEFAELLGYHIEPIMLYQDMTARDLLQQRTTLPNGDTAWRYSPLVTAALDGSLAVLDGVHRINHGSFAVLHRLVHDRELTLFDGTRLLRHDRYEQIKETYDLTDTDMINRSIFSIHPSFRIIALAEPPVVGSSTQQWLTPELLTAFLYHPMRPLSMAEEVDVLQKLVPTSPDLSSLLSFVHKMRQSHDPTILSLASSLSTRQLLRIARRLAQYPSDDLYSAIQKSCLSRFLPRLARTALEQSLEEADILKPQQQVTMEAVERSVTCEVKDNILRIGNTEVSVYNPENRMKVPDILFYENPQHLSVMEDMLKDYLLGEHLLLVGNQGVGKNKIIDRFLYLLNRPREYLQLHRDTTVQTLTLQPTVQDGIIIYEDSPLVRAVKMGHILVVDEADKASTHVTCILKTLVESGEMHLADGRRIVTASSGLPSSENVIVTHPDFRMMVLANRPGFPFLGNDFFGAMGDIFSCHAIDNPNMESEMSMLRQYGPHVPEHVLEKLVVAFGELRDLADQGLISYPYSTREVVNMVKHLEKFPEEGLTNVVKNVFDFDSYNKELQEMIVQTMEKHGIPLGATSANVNLAKEFPLPKFEFAGIWNVSTSEGRKKTSVMSCPVESRTLGIKGPVQLTVEQFSLDRTEARSSLFTEQQSYWTIPMHDTNIISDLAVRKGESASRAAPGQKVSDVIHVATAHPICVYSMSPDQRSMTGIDLYDVFPSTRGAYRPHVKIAAMGASLYDTVVLHEEVTNVVLSINVESGNIMRIISPFLPEPPKDRWRFQSNEPTYRMCGEFAHEAEGMLVFYKVNGDTVEVMNMLEGVTSCVQLPILIQSLHLVAKDDWLIVEANEGKKYMLKRQNDQFFLHAIHDEGNTIPSITYGASTPLNDDVLSQALEMTISSPNRVLVTSESYTSVVIGLPDLQPPHEIYVSPREPLPDNDKHSKADPLFGLMGSIKPAAPNLGATLAYLPKSGQVIRALNTRNVPEAAYPYGVKPRDLSGYLEVTDAANHKLRYIPVPGASRQSPYTSWLLSVTDVNIFMAPMSDDGLVTVDAGGCVRLWETSLVNLGRSLQQWRNMIGQGDDKHLQMTIDKDGKGRDPTSPKHGKEDPDNVPHVGGNTWAGGTGGADTAGLGGVGGPYRLDAGHDVHQVSQVDKDAVPEEVREAARQMAQKAFKQRLREIQMSEYDADTYEKFSRSVRKQVQSLRVILDSLQAKGKERQWLKNQTYGDLDEAKLIEGITGERSIYRRRGEQDPEMGSPQEKPKRLRLVVDVSGSMYRFNGHDGRMERQLEAILMVMEAFEGYEEKFKYDVYGHSGEDYKVEFVHQDKVPKNNKERMDILKVMHAHSQFCLSGDNTVEATKHAVTDLGKEEADEHFVIVLSDANFDRYGISPRRFGDLLTADDKVNSYAIFIGSLGDQASRLTKQLPLGRGFVCMDTKNIPQILQQIFTSTMLSTR
ncbi:von Willebrand factor A domain-containing protein 8-like [Liolophura sinensis]|uniref:von Willebrand factor A domain-containing protein 8-like n=1 Tax=Liolophura sinensis TaxID=3198878 RepID=UPI0031593555